MVKSIGSNSVSVYSTFDEMNKNLVATKSQLASVLKDSKANLAKVEKILTDFENKWK